MEVPCWALGIHLEEEAASLKTRQKTDWGFLNLYFSNEKEKYLQKLYKIEGILLPELRRNKGQTIIQELLWFYVGLSFLSLRYEWKGNGLKSCSQTTCMHMPHLCSSDLLFHLTNRLLRENLFKLKLRKAALTQRQTGVIEK